MCPLLDTVFSGAQNCILKVFEFDIVVLLFLV